MAIRDARNVDIPAMIDVLKWAESVSVFADSDIKLDVPEAKRLLVQALQRQGHTNNGGTYVAVAEKAGKVEGFILGILDRIQGVGDKLCASDLFWLCTPNADPRDAARLYRGLTAWAESAPKCRRIFPGVTRAIGDVSRVEKILTRQGFKPYGAIYVKEVSP